MRLGDVGVVGSLLAGGLSWETELLLVLPRLGWTESFGSWRSGLLRRSEPFTWFSGVRIGVSGLKGSFTCFGGRTLFLVPVSLGAGMYVGAARRLWSLGSEGGIK